MPPKLIVEVVGDTSGLQKSFQRTTTTAKELDRSLSHAARGAVAGSGAFRSLGRSLAFASGGFIAFAGAGEALRSVIDAGTEAAASQRQLAAQLKATGISFAGNRREIEDTATRLSSLSGFTRDELTQSFTTLVRSTREVGPALRDMGIAADVARGRHLSLAQATIALAKAAAGNVTSLKRLGIEIPKGTSGMQALRIVAQRYAGQAEAGATAQQRFAATLHTTEELIGTALLPTLDKYLSQLTVWLEKMNESGQLQLKTAAAVRALTDAADAATPALKQMSDAFKIASNHSLGLERALKWALGLPNIFTVGAVAVDDFNHVFGRTKKAADDARVAVGAFIHTIGALPGTTRSPLLPQQNVNVPGIFPDPFADARPLPAVTPRKPFTAIQRNTFFDASLARSLDRVQDIPTLKGQISKLHEISGLVTQRLAITKDITRKLTLEDDLAQIARTIRGDQATIADKEAGDAKTAAEKAKKLAETIAKANKTRLDALATQLAAGQKFTKSFQTLLGQRAQQNQFLALGLTRTGDALAPSKGNLQAELKKVQAGLAGTLFDTDANRNLLSRIRKVLGGQFDALTRETRLKVKELLDALAGDTKGGPATLRSAASISQLIAGTGVQGAALRRLELNLAGAHLTTMPVGRGGAPFVIHTHVHVDKQELGRTVTEVQGVDARRRPVQTRGRQTSSRSL